MFCKKGNKGVDYKARLQQKLYLARENPEPVFDISDCALKAVPTGIYSLCKVFRKEALYLQDNLLTSLGGGGTAKDLSLLHILDLHSNCFVQLPDDIGQLKNLRVLNVSNNQLKVLPSTIGQLQRLRVLNVSSNNLKAIPNSCGDLRKLQVLDLRKNKHLKMLSDNLAQARNIKELHIDPEEFKHPPKDIAEQGTVAIMKYLAEQLGVEYLSASDSANDSPEGTHSPFSYAEWEEKDKSYQAKILQLERLKGQKQQERLALERDLGEQQKKELELQNASKSNKGRLLDDLVEQQNKLESEIHRIQQDREVERQKLIQQLQEVERTADSVISQLMALSASKDSKHFQQLIEQEQEEERRLLNIAQAEYKSFKRKDVIKAMETLLEEECRKEQKLREYEEGRTEVTRTLLSQQVETDRQLEDMLSTKGHKQNKLVSRIQKDEELQRAAVGALLERSDARSWGLVHQVALVESQLAALTAVEMERRKLEMTEQVMELSEKRVALSALLLDLLSQQAQRRLQLLNTLTEMERRRWVDEEGESKGGDFWLRQYQRLLDSRPTNLVEMEQSLDPLFAHYLVVCGAIHCLPFLVKWVTSAKALRKVDETALKKAGVLGSDDRDSILRAIKLYLEEVDAGSGKVHEQPQPSQSTKPDPRAKPSAPPESEAEHRTSTIPVAECVVCMEEKCEVIFVPCGHMCCCIKCAEQLTECPLCRSEIERKIRVLLP